MMDTKSRTVTLPGMAQPGPHPGARPGVGARMRAPGGRASPHGSGRAQPEGATWGRLPVGSPPAGGTVRGRCLEDRAAVEGGGLDNPIPGHGN